MYLQAVHSIYFKFQKLSIEPKSPFRVATSMFVSVLVAVVLFGSQSSLRTGLISPGRSNSPPSNRRDRFIRNVSGAALRDAAAAERFKLGRDFARNGEKYRRHDETVLHCIYNLFTATFHAVFNNTRGRRLPAYKSNAPARRVPSPLSIRTV